MNDSSNVRNGFSVRADPAINSPKQRDATGAAEYARKKTILLNGKIRARQLSYSYLLAHPCEDCGEPRPECLEFDHIDPRTKKAAVCDLVKAGRSVRTIIAEIAKCRVLCANCHRCRTAKDQGWYKQVRDNISKTRIAWPAGVTGPPNAWSKYDNWLFFWYSLAIHVSCALTEQYVPIQFRPGSRYPDPWNVTNG